MLARLAAHVVSVERHGPLADSARDALEAAGTDNVTVVHGDGTLGHPDRAPYDAIVVTNLCVPTASGVPLRLLPKEINGVRIVGIDVGALPQRQLHHAGIVRADRQAADVPGRRDQGLRQGEDDRPVTLADRAADRASAGWHRQRHRASAPGC